MHTEIFADPVISRRIWRRPRRRRAFFVSGIFGPGAWLFTTKVLACPVSEPTSSRPTHRRFPSSCAEVHPSSYLNHSARSPSFSSTFFTDVRSALEPKPVAVFVQQIVVLVTTIESNVMVSELVQFVRFRQPVMVAVFPKQQLVVEWVPLAHESGVVGVHEKCSKAVVLSGVSVITEKLFAVVDFSVAVAVQREKCKTTVRSSPSLDCGLRAAQLPRARTTQGAVSRSQGRLLNRLVILREFLAGGTKSGRFHTPPIHFSTGETAVRVAPGRSASPSEETFKPPPASKSRSRDGRAPRAVLISVLRVWDSCRNADGGV